MPGGDVQTPTPGQARRLGEAVGRLHRSGISGEGLPVVEPLATVEEVLTACAPWLDADDERWVRTAVERQSATAERVVSGSGEAICHGDLRIANAFFVVETPTLFDLEALGVGPPVYDCACMWRRRVLENDFTVPKDWEFFKQGYEGVTQAGEEQWRLVPPLAVLRALWTMSLPALPNASWGEQWVRDPDYWRAHVRMLRWFAEAAEKGEPA